MRILDVQSREPEFESCIKLGHSYESLNLQPREMETVDARSFLASQPSPNSEPLVQRKALSQKLS